MTKNNKSEPVPDYENPKLNIHNIENSDAEYLLELEDPLSEPLKLKIEKIKNLRNVSKDLYSRNFKPNTDTETLKKKYSDIDNRERKEEIFLLAGRIMVFRKHGKATFSIIKDFSGQIQLYLNINNIGEEKYNE
ncbi:MAG TPA: hypothetical protein GXZ93_04955, partial [Actinobacteria bacterium]|nr:hypothetical protein [Actinomycetota bacterium]